MDVAKKNRAGRGPDRKPCSPPRQKKMTKKDQTSRNAKKSAPKE